MAFLVSLCHKTYKVTLTVRNVVTTPCDGYGYYKVFELRRNNLTTINQIQVKIAGSNPGIRFTGVMTGSIH